MRYLKTVALVMTFVVCPLGVAAGTTGGPDERNPPATQTSTKGPEPMQPAAESSDILVAEYEAAIGMEFFFREDRQISGVWRTKNRATARFPKPTYIVADQNNCLYGCTGSVWEPIDCPGRKFLTDGHLPMNVTLKAAIPTGRAAAPKWRWQSPTAPVSGRFVLTDQNSRPVETVEPSDGQSLRRLICWVDENPNGMFPKIVCCSYFTHASGLARKANAMQRTVSDLPDMLDGSIILRPGDGQDYCLEPGGSFGVCGVDSGIKANGIK